MPVDFDWDNDAQTVLRVIPTPPWNWNDFHKGLRRAAFWLDAVDHDVEILIDLRRSGKLPAGVLGHIRSLGVSIHPNSRDRAVIIGLDETIAAPLGGADHTYQDSARLIRFVETDAEAQAVLAQWQAETS
ncbi:MAG: hypothetical protein K8J31_21645 [Anaerolineae bacterium]|nr:hypothetical protein [Anaerolineae bacterium]